MGSWHDEQPWVFDVTPRPGPPEIPSPYPARTGPGQGT
jgi:hypothetical protein